MRVFVKVLVDAYEREESSPQQKKEAIEAICELHEFVRNHGGEWEGEEPDHILRVCTAEIRRCASDSDEESQVRTSLFADVVGRCLRYTEDAEDAEDAEMVHSLLQDGHFIQWVFDGCMASDIDMYREYYSMLVFLLGWASVCKSIIILFCPQLCAVLTEIFKREADTDPSTLRDLAQIPEIAGVLATMPSLFRDWYCEWWSKECDQKMWKHAMKRCDIVLNVLESVLDSPSTLHDLLGNGALAVAKHYSQRSAAHWSARPAAAVFGRIIEMYPKWRHQFRLWTINGKQGNPTADLGRSIPPKPERAGCEYIFEEEED